MIKIARITSSRTVLVQPQNIKHNLRYYATLHFPKPRYVDGKRLFSRVEVASHNRPTDAWIIIDDKVYNVSFWIPYHPGGEKVLLKVIGKDATWEFKDVGHSWMAMEELSKLEIGYIDSKKRYTVQEHSPLPRDQIGEEGGFH